MIFEISEAEHHTFRRTGDDLVCVVMPNPLRLLTGTSMQVRTLDDRRVDATFAPLSLATTVAGEGMPTRGERRGAARRGDMIVHAYFDAAELARAASSWGRVGAMIVAFYLFLSNPTLCVMLLMGYRLFAQAG